MGLDVYVLWDGMTEEELNAHFAGFQKAGKAGYLRQSWGSLEAWNDIFVDLFGKSWDDMLGREAGSGNFVDGPSFAEHRDFFEARRKELQAYVDDPRPPSEHIRKMYFGAHKAPEDATKIVVEEVKRMIDFINLGLAKAEQGAYVYFG